MKEKTLLDLFLNYQMKSSDGDELKSALESTIIEERQWSNTISIALAALSVL